MRALLTALRVMVGVCSGLRLATNVLMHHVLQAPPGCYLPAFGFGTSLAFNAGCIALPHLLELSMYATSCPNGAGGALVVFDLSEVSEMQEPKGGRLRWKSLTTMAAVTRRRMGLPADREVAQSSVTSDELPCDLPRVRPLDPLARALAWSWGNSGRKRRPHRMRSVLGPRCSRTRGTKTSRCGHIQTFQHIPPVPRVLDQAHPCEPQRCPSRESL